MKSLENIKYLANKGFNIIPLAKGAYPEHIEISASKIEEWKFKIIAFHITEYLTAEERPWPYIQDYSITALDLMNQNIKVILKHGFEEILLIGGASPRHCKKLLKLDDRIKLAGYSWYLDAQNRRLYTSDEYVKDVSYQYYECNCPICIKTPPAIRRQQNHIAKHNLYINKHLINDEGKVEVELYDLIVDEHEDIAIAAELYVGHQDSLWRTLINLIEKIKPSHLILLGPIIYNKNWKIETIEEWKEFIEKLTQLNKKYKTIITIVPDPKEKRNKIETQIQTLYTPNQDPKTNQLQETKYDTTILKIIRLYSNTKTTIKIKKLTNQKPITIRIETPQIIKPEKPQITDLKTLIKDTEWLITNYINQPIIDKQNKIITTGTWRTTWTQPTKPKPAIIHITKQAKIKIIKP